MANNTTRIITGQVFIAGGAVGSVLAPDANNSTATRQVGMSVTQLASAGELLATCNFQEDGVFGVHVDYDNFISPLTAVVDFQEDGVFTIVEIQTQQTYSAAFQEDGVFGVFADYGTFVPPLTVTVDFQEDGIFVPVVTTAASLELTTAFGEDGTMVIAAVKAVRKPARMVCVISG